MPFDPNSPFDPTDPAQWWLRTRVQPGAPPNPPFGNTAKSGAIDNRSVLEDDGLPNDWFVPDADGYPNDWFVPEADGYPNDWFVPDANGYAPTSVAAPRTAPPAPSPQTNAANPAAFNRPPARLDPLAAYWAQVPASRVGAMAWHPPIFLSPDSFSPQITESWARGGPPAAFSIPLERFAPAASALPTLPPDFGTGGILGGIAKLAAEHARANDPWALPTGGILGGIPKLTAAYASSDAVSLAASRGLFGSLADLQPADSSAQAAASGADTTPPITTPFPVGPGLGPNDPGGAGDTPEGLGPQYYRRAQTDGFPTPPSFDASRPPIRLVHDDESPPEEKHGAPPQPKSDPSSALNPFGESNSIAGRIGWGAGTPSTALVPSRAGPPLPPPLQAPPPPTRALPPPPASPPPGTSPSTSPRQSADSPRPSPPPVGPGSVILPSQKADAGGAISNLPFGIGSGPYAGEPIPVGPGKRPSTAQQNQINASGDKYGCHMCGAPDPGTPLGNWIGDHQTPTAINPPGQQQVFLPHCLSCSLRQGGLLKNFIQRQGK
jgi:hypothetical protein